MFNKWLTRSLEFSDALKVSLKKQKLTTQGNTLMHLLKILLFENLYVSVCVCVATLKPPGAMALVCGI